MPSPLVCFGLESRPCSWAKIVGVSRFGGMAAFDPIHSAASDHFALAVYYQIDFFCCRDDGEASCASGSKSIQKKTCPSVGFINQIPLPELRPTRSFVQN